MERHLINENDDFNTLTVLKTKYPQSIISHQVLETLYNEDPTEDKSLFDWMVKQNIKSSHKNDVNNLLIRLVKDFVLFQDKLQIKDINFYHSAEILENIINDIRSRLTKQERKKYKIEEGEDFYEDSKFRVTKPRSISDICNAGYDTAWCGTSNTIPENINDYAIYIVFNKTLKKPDVSTYDDHHTFNVHQEKYHKLRKLLLIINKKFKGTPKEADLDDYFIYDVFNNEYHCSISRVTNPHIENIIFKDFEVSGKNDKVKRELELPDLNIIENWCKHTNFDNKHILLERYQQLVETYQNPELVEGDRIELVYMSEPYKSRPPKGTKGTVTRVEKTPWGIQYGVKWENGSSLSIIPSEDIYKKL